MRILLFLLILFRICTSSSIENWVDSRLKILEESPLKIEFEIEIKNEFEEYSIPVEVDILNFQLFQVHLSGKSIYFSDKWSKVFDKKSNQVIIDYPDTVLLNNLQSVLLEKINNQSIECKGKDPTKCLVQIPEFGIIFEALIDEETDSLYQISYSLNNTNSRISDIRITRLNNPDESIWNPPFKNKFKLDLRN